MLLRRLYLSLLLDIMSELQISNETAEQLKAVPCIQLRSPEGVIRLVKSGEPYRKLPGEEIMGVDRTCAGTIKQAVKTKDGQLRTELDSALGSGAGDWIRTMVKPFAKLIGKDQCSACEARRIATNAYAKLKGQHGQLEALRIMKELWQDSFTQKPDDVLRKLETYLK